MIRLGEILAKVAIYGDIHLSSKSYGAHRDYPNESLYYFKLITDKTIEKNATHLIGLGDLTYGRFNTLEYREQVEAELERQIKQVGNNRYELKGNHDSATYGMTEYEYYVKKGKINTSRNIRIGKVNISMVDSGQHNNTEILIDNDSINVVLAHDFFKFSDTEIADYGKSIILDDLHKWYGIDYLICGHIHNYHLFKGLMIKEGIGKETLVNYLGSLCRPSFRAGHMDEVGRMCFLTIMDDGTMEYEIEEIPLLSLEESFNLELKAEQAKAKEEKENRLDISDIVQQLNSHERNIGNPEDIIAAMGGIDAKYKNKAIELLKAGQA